MLVKIVFRLKEERIESVVDFHFEPGHNWKSSPFNDEKRRIKQLIEPFYKWVKTLK
jgi:hypothetical protein